MCGVATADFGSVGFGGRVVVTGDAGFITNVLLHTPSNNTDPTSSCTVNISVRIQFQDDSQLEYFWVEFYNRTGGDWTLIDDHTVQTTIGGGLNKTAYYTWSSLGYDTTYWWACNVSHNETVQWFNMSDHSPTPEGYWVFTTPLEGESTQWSSVGFGGRVVVTEDIIPSNWHSVGFGGRVVVESEEPGSSDYSGWWEFYKITSRYDVNVDGYVLASDANKVWSQREGAKPYDYLYDVSPTCNPDGYVTSADANKVWTEREGFLG